jgi:hypothetical protein
VEGFHRLEHWEWPCSIELYLSVTPPPSTVSKSKRGGRESELEIEAMVVSSLVRENPLSGAANTSAVVEPIANFPESDEGLPRGSESCLKMLGPPKLWLSDDNTARVDRYPRNKEP